MVYLIMMLGTALILFTQVLASSIKDGNIDLDGVVHRPLPAITGSLVLSGSLIHVAIGVMSYRPNRVYYRFSVIVK